MVDVLTETIINRPVEAVADYAANPDNAPIWYRNIRSAQWQTSPPLQVGSRVAFVAGFLGRRLSYVYEITEFVPGERLVMRTAQGPFPMETTYTWEAAGDGATRMTLRNRGEPAGFSRIMAPFVGAMMRGANKADLRSIRQTLESSTP